MTVRSVPGHCARVGSGDASRLLFISGVKWLGPEPEATDRWTLPSGRHVGPRRPVACGWLERKRNGEAVGVEADGTNSATRRDAAAGATGPRLPRRIRAGWIGCPGSNDLGGGGGRQAEALLFRVDLRWRFAECSMGQLGAELVYGRIGSDISPMVVAGSGLRRRLGAQMTGHAAANGGSQLASGNRLISRLRHVREGDGALASRLTHLTISSAAAACNPPPGILATHFGHPASYLLVLGLEEIGGVAEG
nr:unnamed protein product [Digitaria exilis]